MLGKEVKVFLKNGMTEAIACTDFKIGVDQEKAVMMFQVGPQQMYMLQLEKIDHYDVRFIWIFTDGPFLPPSRPLV